MMRLDPLALIRGRVRWNHLPAIIIEQARADQWMVVDVGLVAHRAGKRKRAGCAVNIDSIGPLLVVAFVRFEVSGKTIPEDVVGAYAVAGHEPHPLRAFHQIIRRRVAAILGDMGVTPQRLTPDLPQKIKEVGVEVEKQLVAPFMAVHAVDAGETRLADLASLYQGDGNVLDGRVAPPRACHNQQLAILFASRRHLIDLRGRGRHRLLDVNVRLRGRRGHGQFMVIPDLASGDHSDVGPFFSQHLSVVGISSFCAGALERLLAAAVVRVSQGCDLGPLDPDKSLVNIMAVVPATGVSDNGDSLSHDSSVALVRFAAV